MGRDCDRPETLVLESNHVWGTWEELLLASAVKRHGIGDWDVVSFELQARARARSVPPSFFTEEACRSKYYSMKRRFCGNDDRDGELGSSMPWFEELRKLRVDHLKRELEHYHDSIGSLQNKLKRLKEESSQGILRISGKTVTCADYSENATSTSPVDLIDSGIGSSRGCVQAHKKASHIPRHCVLGSRPIYHLEQSHIVKHLDGLENEKRKFKSELREDAATIKSSCRREELRVGIPIRIEEFERGKSKDGKVRHVGINCCPSETRKMKIAEWKQSTPAQNAQLTGSKKDKSTDGRNAGMVHPGAFLECQSKIGAALALALPLDSEIELSGNDKTKSAEVNSVDEDADIHLQSGVENRLIIYENSKGEEFMQKERTESERNLQLDMELKTVTNKGDIAIASGRNSDDSTSTRSLIKKGKAHRDLSKHRVVRGIGNVKTCSSNAVETKNTLITCNLKNNEELSDGAFHKMPCYIQKSFDRIEVPFVSFGFQSESPHLDSTESSPQNDAYLTVAEISAPKIANSNNFSAVASRNTSDIYQPLQSELRGHIETRVTTNEQAISQDKYSGHKHSQQVIEEHRQNLASESTDSTGNGEAFVEREVPCQVEVAATAQVHSRNIKDGFQNLAISSEPLRSKERQRVGTDEKYHFLEVSGESAKVMVNKRVTVEQGMNWGQVRNSESMSLPKELTSACKDDNEAMNSMKPVEISPRTELITMNHEDSGTMKEANEWQQDVNQCGDSQAGESEVGSPEDGNEGPSPMSHRHRGETKVIGKLPSLLKCLRTICAHRCAAVFQHKQESQEHSHYNHLIRTHIDLSMIRDRLEEGFYPASMYLFRDLLLMINNAWVYYPRKSQEFAAATGMHECVRKQMTIFFETEALLRQDGPATRKCKPKMFSPAAKSASLKQGMKRGRTSALNVDGIWHKASPDKEEKLQDTYISRKKHPSRILTEYGISAGLEIMESKHVWKRILR